MPGVHCRCTSSYKHWEVFSKMTSKIQEKIYLEKQIIWKKLFFVNLVAMNTLQIMNFFRKPSSLKNSYFREHSY